jgi:hypothetical protein
VLLLLLASIKHRQGCARNFTISASCRPPGAAAHRNQLHILSSIGRYKQRVAAPGGQHAGSRQLSGLQALSGDDVDGKRVAQQVAARWPMEQDRGRGGGGRAQSAYAGPMLDILPSRHTACHSYRLPTVQAVQYSTALP